MRMPRRDSCWACYVGSVFAQRRFMCYLQTCSTSTDLVAVLPLLPVNTPHTASSKADHPPVFLQVMTSWGDWLDVPSGKHLAAVIPGYTISHLTAGELHPARYRMVRAAPALSAPLPSPTKLLAHGVAPCAATVHAYFCLHASDPSLEGLLASALGQPSHLVQQSDGPAIFSSH